MGGRLPADAVPGRALPVLDERGEFDSWFVPLVSKGQLAGFLQYGRALVLRRASVFPRPVESAEWLDPERIRERAGALAGRAGAERAPYLSFDGSPDRIAWRCEFRTPTGARRTIFVAGTLAYEQSAPADPLGD